MATTLSDIAQRAGCSTATVSRALNGTASVHQATYASIVAAARELGDGLPARPGAAARARPPGRPRGSLRKSDTVDIVVFRREGVEPLISSSEGLTVAPLADATPDMLFSARYRLSTDYYRHIIEGAVSMLSAGGMKAVQQLRSDLLDDAFIRELRTARRRGLLLLGEPSADVQTFVNRCECPLVLVDILGVTGRPVVATDNVGGIRAMVRHLVDLGHRAIGFAGHAANPSYGERRLSFNGQMLEAGLTVRSEWQYDGSSHIEDVARGSRAVLARRHRPTAVVCCSDWVAMGVVQAARELGLDVPRDVSVSGFDDVDAAALITPPLTTVQAPMYALGAQAVRLLLGDMLGREGGAPWGYEVRLRTNLVVRGTTAAPRAS
jgi:LacI family transcriptional regulator